MLNNDIEALSCLMSLFRLGPTQAFGARVWSFLFSKRGTSKTWKIIEALRCSVLLVNCLLLFLTIDWMIGLKIIMFILKHRLVLEKVWAQPTLFFFILHGIISHCINNNDIFLRHFSTLKKHLTILCMRFCGLNLRRWAFVEKIQM